MSTPNGRKRLPTKPSEEHLRKQAKRRANAEALPLAEAQHRIAVEHGCRNWAELMRVVETMNRETDELKDVRGWPPLHLAARAGRVEEAKRLIEAGAHVNHSLPDGTTALHVAAAAGPLAMVELLLSHGAREWIADNAGRLPRDTAATGVAREKAAIVETLTRPVIRDPNFRAAVAAIHAGDVAALRCLLAAHPELSRVAAEEPACYPPGYFGNPKLLWFVANNPTLIKTMPANVVEIADAIIDAGVDANDLNYTLGLVMTSDTAVNQNLQRPLMLTLLRRGATATPHDVVMTLGHAQIEPVRVLLEQGVPMTAVIAAGLGDVESLRPLLSTISAAELHDAFSMAVINGRVDAARLCLQAGADVNGFLAVHAHSMPVHHAAGQDDVAMLRLLVEHGSRLSDPDTLWRGTPLGWAMHQKCTNAETFLRSVGAE